jgi:hypothetical protein
MSTERRHELGKRKGGAKIILPCPIGSPFLCRCLFALVAAASLAGCSTAVPGSPYPRVSVVPATAAETRLTT